jgi:hypothetical protein
LELLVHSGLWEYLGPLVCLEPMVLKVHWALMGQMVPKVYLEQLV